MMTTDLKHTPEPWAACERGDYADEGIVILGNDRRIAVVNLEQDDRLIAAAPDLLAALIGLKFILATAESNASGNPEWEAVSAKINAARAAIAKATGK